FQYWCDPVTPHEVTVTRTYTISNPTLGAATVTFHTDWFDVCPYLGQQCQDGIAANGPNYPCAFADFAFNSSDPNVNVYMDWSGTLGTESVTKNHSGGFLNAWVNTEYPTATLQVKVNSDQCCSVGALFQDMWDLGGIFIANVNILADSSPD